MRKYLLKMVLFTTPLIFIVVGMEIMIRHIPNEYTLKKKYLDENSSSIETLILGSSHTYAGLNPALFRTRTFNAANKGQLLLYDYKIFNTYQKDFKNLKTIILPISYPSFWGNYKENSSVSQFEANYINYYGFGKFYEVLNFSEFSKHRLLANLKKIEKYYVKGSRTIPCTALGWSTQYKSENKRDILESLEREVKWQTIENIDSEEYKTIFNENISILKSILEWSQHHNVTVILFTPPATEIFRNTLNTKQLARMESTATNIAQDYTNCTYINLIADIRFVSSDYWDAHHLLEPGAVKLSRILDSIQVNFKADSYNKRVSQILN